MLALDISRALDPVLFANDCGITPDAWQAALLRDRPKRALLCCSRQSGKSLVTSLLALWTASYQPSANIFLFSPSQRQSAELFRSIMVLNAKLESAPPLVSESVLKAEFANGSRILALPGTEKTVRGLAAADLICIDEAARVDDLLLAGIRPMAATKPEATIIALSTPAGRRGWYFEAFTKSDDWHKISVPASACPRISKEFLAEELRELGPIRFSEEYELTFRDSHEKMFNSDLIERAFSSEVRALWAA